MINVGAYYVNDVTWLCEVLSVDDVEVKVHFCDELGETDNGIKFRYDLAEFESTFVWLAKDTNHLKLLRI
jgi:hypothetical protein